MSKITNNGLTPVWHSKQWGVKGITLLWWHV